MSSVPGTRNPIDARCAPRERASAIAAIAAAFLVALAVFLAAFLARREGGGSGIGERGSLANAGIGDGNGPGVGPGRGTGAADTGAASGSGHEGPGRGARGATEPLPPPGAEPESVASADAAPAAEAAPTIEPPEFGFTAPDRPEPEPMPVPIVVVGVPDGLESAGGAGGPGGDGLRIAELSTLTRVIAIERDGREAELNPRRDTVFEPGDTLYLVGPYHELLETLRRGQRSATRG